MGAQGLEVTTSGGMGVVSMNKKTHLEYHGERVRGGLSLGSCWFGTPSTIPSTIKLECIPFLNGCWHHGLPINGNKHSISAKETTNIENKTYAHSGLDWEGGGTKFGRFFVQAPPA